LQQYFASLKKPPQKREKPVAKRYVKTKAVQYQDIETQVTAFGRVISGQPLTLSSEVSGRILQGTVPLKSGQAFRKGDLLFKVDDTEQRLNLQSVKSDYIKMLASALPELKIDFPDRYDHWLKYYRSISIDSPLPDMPEFSNDQERTFIVTRDLLKTYFTIKSTEARLQKHYIYAPYNGSISDVLLEIGSYVNPGNGIAEIVRTDQIELEVPVETDDVQWLKIGAPVTISSENGMQEWKGQISRIGDVVAQNTQSINIYIKVFRNEHPIFDGLFLRAEMPGYTLERAMEMPRNALVDQNKVFVVEQDSILQLKDIQVLKVNKETVLFKGLDQDADLVVEPLVNAYSSMIVYKLDASPNKINREISSPSDRGQVKPATEVESGAEQSAKKKAS